MEMNEVINQAVNELVPMAALVLVDYVSVTAAVGVDLVSGLSKAGREGRRRTSRGLRRTVSKLTGYMMMLAAMGLLDFVLTTSAVYLHVAHGVSIPVLPLFTTLGALGLCIIEGKSVVENSRNRDEIARLAGDKRLGRIIERILNKLI